MATLVKIQGNAIFNGGVKFQVTGVNTPLTPSLSSITSSGFTLSWDQVQDAFEYQLDISTNSNFSSFVAGYNNTTVPTTSAVVTGLSPQTTYWARIRAVVASTNSASVSGTTLEATSTLTNGLLAFYKLSDTSDSSGNNRTLTNNGGVTFSSGKIGNAALINADQSLTIAPDVQYGNTFSIIFWVKWLQQSHANLAAQYPGLWLGILPNGSIQLSDLNSWESFSAPGLITTGVWNHYASVVTNGYAKVYLNNTLVLEENNHQMTLNSTAGRGFGIGGETFYSRLGQKEIDAFGVWNRALSDAEVAELYNAGNGLEIN